MAIKELNLNLIPSSSNIIIRGRRDVLSKNIEGGWATLFKGRGMEFTGYRQYSFSDDASSIDWRASLRSKDLLIREYEEFKNFNILFVLDTSNGMLFTTGDKFKAEFGAELLYDLADESSTAGDAIGLTIFNDSIKEVIQPAYGRGMTLRFSKTLHKLENYGGLRDFKKSMLQLSSIIQERCIIVLISDFINLPEDWMKYVVMLSKKHHVIGIMVRDKRDYELPDVGQFSLKDPNSNQTIYIDTKQFANKYKEYSKKEEETVVSFFKKIKSNCLVLENEDLKSREKMKMFFSRLYNMNI
ncbi:MAG: DUF58 domain-containing protein [Candidatus Woesearchaeota archaeon]